ncbi:transposase [Holospora curviuscula]
MIMDHASFHNAYNKNALIESCGFELVFLLSYSPDLNFIETF